MSHVQLQSRPTADAHPHTWFNRAHYGLFIHWGPYAGHGRGEQVLIREHLDPREYELAACRWNPQHYDAAAWADIAKRAGMKYAVLTTRHHDGYCLWDSQLTDYTSAKQAPQRDFVAEYAKAFGDAGIRVGLYYSLLDWRVPTYWRGPKHDAQGWSAFRDYVHGQVEELLTNYGDVAVLWFDGSWPHTAEQWGAQQLMSMARRLQPNMMVNNRMGDDQAESLGDFGTPEQKIKAESHRPWESCQTTSWRLWGYAANERYRSAEQLLDTLCQVTQQGGNLLLNVGPDGEGRLPDAFVERADAVGRWLDVHRPAIEAADHPADGLTESCSYGYQTIDGCDLYLIMRFWPNASPLRLPDLPTPVKHAALMTTGQSLRFEQRDDVVFVYDLPAESPIALFPVVKLTFDRPPQTTHWGRHCRMWQGDALDRVAWADQRGESVNAYRTE